MRNLGRTGVAAASVFLGLIVLFVPPLLTPASVPKATGHFEEYCDGVGIFLAKVDGAPASGKLVFFSYLGFRGAHSASEFLRNLAKRKPISPGLTNHPRFIVVPMTAGYGDRKSVV